MKYFIILLIFVGSAILAPNVFAEEITLSPINETKLCGGDAILVDGVCQVVITHNVSIFSNKGFITFLIVLVVLIPVLIGLVVYWRKRK